jgi:hypothetical protein
MSQELRKSKEDGAQLQIEFNQTVNIPKIQHVRANLLFRAMMAPVSKTLKRSLY